MTAANMLLESLGLATRERLAVLLEPVSLVGGAVVAEAGVPATSLYFPCGAVIASGVPMDGSRTVEIGLVGCDGIAPISAAFGLVSPVRAVVKVPGAAMSIRAEALRTELNKDGELRELLENYANLYLAEVSLIAACSRLHDLKSRLATLVLTCLERAGSERLPLTSESVSRMLNSRRAGVVVALEELKLAGLVKLSRGSIDIIDCAGLAAKACECYERLKRGTETLLGARALTGSHRGNSSGLGEVGDA